jgi:hypothetical protein
MVKKFICGLVALGSFGFLLLGADNAFVGTWKLNVAKSKFAKGQEATDATIVVSVEGDTTTVTTNSTGGFFGPGKQFSSKFTVPTAGGPLNYTEGPPPAGITDTLKSINNRTDDFISTENGKEVLKTHVVVSANHKTMIITRSGVDDKGVAFTSIEAYDRQ